MASFLEILVKVSSSDATSWWIFVALSRLTYRGCTVSSIVGQLVALSVGLDVRIGLNRGMLVSLSRFSLAASGTFSICSLTCLCLLCCLAILWRYVSGDHERFTIWEGVTSVGLGSIDVWCQDDACDLEHAAVRRQRSMRGLATLIHCLRSRSVEFLQRVTLADSVFCLLVDGERTVWEVPADSAGWSLRGEAARPRLDLDRLLHLVKGDSSCAPQAEGHAG